MVLFIGLAGSKGFATEADIALAEGERADVAGYTLVNEGASRTPDAHKSTVSVRVGRLRGRRPGRAPCTPGVITYTVDETRASQVAIDSAPSRDLYLVLTQLQHDGAGAHLGVRQPAGAVDLGRRRDHRRSAACSPPGPARRPRAASRAAGARGARGGAGVSGARACSPER